MDLGCLFPKQMSRVYVESNIVKLISKFCVSWRYQSIHKQSQAWVLGRPWETSRSWPIAFDVPNVLRKVVADGSLLPRWKFTWATRKGPARAPWLGVIFIPVTDAQFHPNRDGVNSVLLWIPKHCYRPATNQADCFPGPNLCFLFDSEITDKP